MNSISRLIDLLADLKFDKDSGAKTVADFKSRPLVCTPYKANHGVVSGWVICVNGSPPKATLLIDQFSSPLIAFHIADKPKKIRGPKQLETIKEFFTDHLKGKEEAFTIPSK